MKKARDLFEALAASPLEMAMLEEGRVGFMIPEYQRQYDWAEANIVRLYYDALNGFARTPESGGANAFTFLGTLILVKEEKKEADFGGVSFTVVDGQQRLTTLSLFACALSEALRRQLDETDFPASVDATLKKWLENEVSERLFALYECAVGSQRISPTRNFPFPRIVRHEDSRGRSKRTSEYKSAVARFLGGFVEYFDGKTIEFVRPSLGSGTDAKKLVRNYDLILRLISNLNDAHWYEETECERFDMSWVLKRQCRTLFDQLSNYFKSDSDQNRALDAISKHKELHGLARTILFASYFSSCIVLTRVITHDESAAFDIFDALNTTGEPLTALETLKPRVINFETKQKGYAGTPSEISFATITENLDQRFSETAKKQSETKDLIVTFALYLEGKKLSKDLASQRTFLRQSYDNAAKNGTESARQFVRALADATQFRRYYWERDGNEELGRFHQNKSVDEVQLLMSFIVDMKSSLALPILSRYWTDDLKHSGGEERFVEVLRAVASFLVLRRAATGGTAGIDSDFRAVMAPRVGRGSNRKFGLCAGVDHKNALLTTDELKTAFKALLTHKLKSLSKENWVGMTTANPLYEQSRELVRFMILTAAHQAMPSDTASGTWKKDGVKASDHTNNFFNYKTWYGDHYATVEHIAPATVPKHGWDASLYKNNILRNTLGNLVLLPAKENSVIGSDSWEKKKKFYLALTETSVAAQDRRIEEANAAGISFSKNMTELLKEGTRLSLLDPLRTVVNWNEDVVTARSRNVAELCWDQIWPWLN